MATINIASRPLDLAGCFQSWSEKQEPNIIRTSMESGVVKVRRRTTGTYRKAAVSVTLNANLYKSFMDWFNINCQQGVLPTRMVTPYKKEEVWRFTSAPQIEWVDPVAFRATFEIEQLPQWKNL